MLSGVRDGFAIARAPSAERHISRLRSGAARALRRSANPATPPRDALRSAEDLLAGRGGCRRNAKPLPLGGSRVGAMSSSFGRAPGRPKPDRVAHPSGSGCTRDRAAVAYTRSASELQFDLEDQRGVRRRGPARRTALAVGQAGRTASFALPPTFIFCTPSVQHSMTRFSGNAPRDRAVELLAVGQRAAVVHAHHVRLLGVPPSDRYTMAELEQRLFLRLPGQ